MGPKGRGDTGQMKGLVRALEPRVKQGGLDGKSMGELTHNESSSGRGNQDSRENRGPRGGRPCSLKRMVVQGQKKPRDRRPRTWDRIGVSE